MTTNPDTTTHVEIEPLTVENMAFAVTTDIETAPPKMMPRELLVNGFEAMKAQGETVRKIRLYADAAGKAIFLNSGIGMDEKELRRATNLSTQIHKKLGLTGRDNRGQGAKIASAKFNRLGLEFTSRKNGQISQTVVLQDPLSGSYGRLKEQVLVGYDDDNEPVHEWDDVWAVTESDLTPEQAERYAEIGGDFTEVRLLGNRPDQKTFLDPYDTGVEGPQLTLGHELFRRFYEFPKGDLPVRVDLHGPSYRGGAKWRPFIPLGEVVRKHPDEFENAAERFATIDGVKIEYIFAKVDDKSHSVWPARSVGQNGGRAALVYQGEMFDVLDGPDWKAAAPSYGVMGLGKQLTVLVHVDDSWDITSSKFRDSLFMNNAPLTLALFKSHIIQGRPKWLLDIIEARRGDRSEDFSEDVKNRLAQFAVRISMKKDKKGPKLLVINGGKGVGTTGSPVSGKATGTGTSPMNTGTGTGGSANGTSGPGKLGGNGGGKKKAGATPGAGKKTSPSVPSHTWVKNPEEDHPLLVERGATYEATEATYYLNEQYPAFEEMIETLFEENLATVPGMIRDEAIETLVRGQVKAQVAVRVGKAILLALRKSGSRTWGAKAMESAYSPEALSVIFDLCKEDIGGISQAIQKSNAFRDAVATQSVSASADDEPEAATA